jgi:hypothetical protein
MFSLKTKGINAIRSALIGLAAKFKVGAESSLYLAAKNIRDEMQQEGLPVTYPINWDSERQRRAFFATDGFGGGIPYQRSGIAVGSWEAVKIDNGAQVSNPLSHIRFLSGSADGSPVGAGDKLQSNIHKGRWKLFYPVWTRVVNALPASIRERLKIVAESQGFKTQ